MPVRTRLSEAGQARCWLGLGLGLGLGLNPNPNPNPYLILPKARCEALLLRTLRR